MKIGIINTTYGDGSTGYLSKKLFDFCSNYCETFFFYGIGKKQNNKKIMKVQNFLGRKSHNLMSRLFGLQGFFSTQSSIKIIKTIKKEKITHLFFCNLHGNYLNYDFLLKKISNLGIKCLQIMWDEFPFTGKCTFSYSCKKYEKECYKCEHLHDYPNSWFFDTSKFIQKRKKILFSKLDIGFVGAPFIVEKAKQSSILKGKQFFILDEAVDQTIFKTATPNYQLMEKLNICPNKIIVLCVCSYPNERKGGQFFVKMARHFEKDDRFIFVHVGVKPGNYSFPPNYRSVGFVNDKFELAEYYNISDLFVCTSLAETQPDACLEALSCGLHICGFDVAGIPSCAPNPIGNYFSIEKMGELFDFVSRASKKTQKTINETCEFSKRHFDINSYCAQLLEIIKKI